MHSDDLFHFSENTLPLHLQLLQNPPGRRSTRMGLNNEPHPCARGRFYLTVNVGVASFVIDPETPEKVMV